MLVEPHSLSSARRRHADQNRKPSPARKALVVPSSASMTFVYRVSIALFMCLLPATHLQGDEENSPVSLTIVSSGKDYTNAEQSALAVQDLVISPGDPDTNLNGPRLLSLGGELQHRMHYGRILLRFDLTSIRERLKKVTSARIILTPSWARMSPSLRIFPVTEADKDWSPFEATWKEKTDKTPWTGGDGGGEPGDGTYRKTPVATAEPDKDGRAVSCDIPPSLVNEWMSISGRNPGLLLQMNQQQGGVGIYAAEAGKKGPRLEVKGLPTDAEQ